jgi:anti-anti-sigma regulatory factor
MSEGFRVVNAVRELARKVMGHMDIDMRKVPRIDSSGIGLLVKGLTLAKEKDGSVQACQPVDDGPQNLEDVRTAAVIRHS